MSGRGSSARLFVAVDPPAEVCQALAGWGRAAAREARSHSRGDGPATTRPAGRATARSRSTGGESPLRVLDAELLHVTICFLGERPAGGIDSIAEQLAACERPAVELSLGAPLWLPPRRPRALAVELHDGHGTLAQVHAEVVSRLAPQLGEQQGVPAGAAGTGRSAGGPRRRFHPHVTVARMRTGDAPRDRVLPPTPARTFAPAELVLYRSWLSPDGASYEALASAPLG